MLENGTQKTHLYHALLIVTFFFEDYIGENESTIAHGEHERVAFTLKEIECSTFFLGIFFLFQKMHSNSHSNIRPGQKRQAAGQIQPAGSLSEIGLACRSHNIHVNIRQHFDDL